MPGEAEQIRRRVRVAAEGAVRRAAEDLLGKAQRLAPVEEGTLRGSGDVEVDASGSTIVATVAFNAVYAARQHEETGWEHPKGGQAKYLEQPLREDAARYDRVIATAMEAALR